MIDKLVALLDFRNKGDLRAFRIVIGAKGEWIGMVRINCQDQSLS
jgi:hypothetical protein